MSLDILLFLSTLYILHNLYLEVCRLLIGKSDMNVLISADELIEVAKSAPYDQQISQIAYLLNTNANCGDTWITWTGELLDDVKDKLESLGYNVIVNDNGAYTSYCIGKDSKK